MDAALAYEVAAVSRSRALDEEIRKGDSEIQTFYKDKVVFVTGASGFLGKNLLEKLLRACDVEKIYILLRPKKGKEIQQRLEQILEDPVFDILKKDNSTFGEKLKPIEGDVSEDNMGIKTQDWKTLTQEVHVIFHVAATVKFNEPLKMATRINVMGTQEMLRLGKACQQLKSFVYVSTMYSHATLSAREGRVEERFYTSPLTARAAIDIAEFTDEGIINDITPELTKNWPNTYTFSKAIAEDAVRLQAGQLPICVVRPSIVTAAYREPVPGWIDVNSVYGPSGLLLGAGLGVIHTVLCNDNIKVDLIPVDIVNNATITAAWKTADNWKRNQKDIKIYNVCNARNYTLWGEHLAHHLNNSRDIVSPKAVWYCSVICTKSPILFLLMSWLFHFIPAYVMDAGLFVIGKKPKFTKLYEKIYNMTVTLSYFTSNQWKFSDTNTLALYKSLTMSDQIIFDFDCDNIEWSEMFRLWYLGIRKYIIKDGLKNTKSGIRKQNYFQIATYAVFAVYAFIFYYSVYFVRTLFRMFLDI